MSPSLVVSLKDRHAKSVSFLHVKLAQQICTDNAPAPISTLRNLLRPNLLKPLRMMHKLRSIRLRNKPPLIRLLHKILIPLLIGKIDRVVLGFEIQVRALHEIRAGLPAHERVLPPMAFVQDVPVHAPVVAGPVA